MAGHELTARSNERFRAAVDAAVRSGEQGDAELATILPTLTRDRQVYVAAALGDCRGAAGDAALRAVLAANAGSEDLRCAAVLGLAKRLGVESSADLLTAFGSRSSGVKQYAICGLAGAGDDRAWDQVEAYLRASLKRTRKGRGMPDERLVALSYLAQHLDGVGGNRTHRLAGLVRGNWAKLDPEASPEDRPFLLPEERNWFERYWPNVRPDGPPAEHVPPPDPAPLRAWARYPLFESLT
ncbi:MAG: hypothetical protein ACT4QG_19145 [Sporichthyaceae bacterium]